jgi:shikimate kinase
MPSLPDSAEHLVLIGMMGSGKSTVGRIVAARLGRPLRDSDDDIELSTGRTVREIFETDGEDVFRTLESQVLADALSSPTPLVIAAAGGVVLREENRVRLRDHACTVWLRAEPQVLAERVEPGDHRPLLADDPAGVLRKLSEERRHLYEEAADHVVDIDGLDPDAVAERVLAAYG